MLTIDQRLVLLDVIDELEAVASIEALVRCADGRLQGLLPHSGFVCGLTDNLVKWLPYWLVNHRFPPQYLGAIRQANGGYDSEMIQRWRATQLPVCADPGARVGRWWSDGWMAHAMAAGLTNLIGHGFVDLNGEGASYFCFIRIPEPLRERHVYLLKRLVPHLHMALMRTRPVAEPQGPALAALASAPALTRRQIQILEWLGQGKTNLEVAAILGTSANNVKYHLKAIFGKLGVSTRAQAVAKAMALKLLAEA
jgi:transcriptional regulator EpsA